MSETTEKLAVGEREDFATVTESVNSTFYDSPLYFEIAGAIFWFCAVVYLCATKTHFEFGVELMIVGLFRVASITLGYFQQKKSKTMADARRGPLQTVGNI